MALIKCAACDKEVSAQAVSCPNCGHPLSKTASTKSSAAGIGCLVIIVVIGALAAIGSGSSGTSSSTQAPSCRTDWARCTDNTDLANNYSRWFNIAVDCKHEANNRAQYGDVWPWLAFGSFYKGNGYITSGIAVAIEPDAQF